MRYSGFILLAAFFAASSAARAQGLPALPHIVPHVCPLECCRLGDWTTSFSPLVIYAEPGVKDRIVDTIPQRTAFDAESSVVVIRQYGVAVVDKPIDPTLGLNDIPLPQPGDTVYLARYEGEDFFLAYLHGKETEVPAFWGRGGPGMGRPKGTPSYGRVLRDQIEEWWVLVRRVGATPGWANMTGVGSVHGMDACGE